MQPVTPAVFFRCHEPDGAALPYPVGSEDPDADAISPTIFDHHSRLNAPAADQNGRAALSAIPYPHSLARLVLIALATPIDSSKPSPLVPGSTKGNQTPSVPR